QSRLKTTTATITQLSKTTHQTATTTFFIYIPKSNHNSLSDSNQPEFKINSKKKTKYIRMGPSYQHAKINGAGLPSARKQRAQPDVYK
ncbi:MAG: hypothetical protein DRH37_11705, partial [Deltaproteobacteria bacterium]